MRTLEEYAVNERKLRPALSRKTSRKAGPDKAWFQANAVPGPDGEPVIGCADGINLTWDDYVALETFEVPAPEGAGNDEGGAEVV